MPDHVALDADDDLVAGRAEVPQGELVGHRPRRDQQGGLGAQQGGDLLLQAVDARVLAVLVVADLGLGDRLTHLGGRAGDGVGAKVDHTAHAI